MKLPSQNYTTYTYVSTPQLKSEYELLSEKLACSPSELISLALFEFIKNHKSKLLSPYTFQNEIALIGKSSNGLFKDYDLDFRKNKSYKSKPGRGYVLPKISGSAYKTEKPVQPKISTPRVEPKVPDIRKVEPVVLPVEEPKVLEKILEEIPVETPTLDFMEEAKKQNEDQQTFTDDDFTFI